MEPSNLLFIMSDEHSRKMLGSYGHEQVRTPNLDRLAKRGTRFSAAYTNSPICVPARAIFATGRYAHETRYWDNAMPYDGKIEGWGQRLQREGIRVESIGKLHYRNEKLPTGFDLQIDPMHAKDGIGQVWGSVRDPLPEERPANILNKIGAGESSYNRYDRMIAKKACEWLRTEADGGDKRPWLLYLGFVAPHFPLVVPEEYLELYPSNTLPPRKLDPEAGFVRHPWLQRMDDFSQIDRRLTAEQRLMAVGAYCGLCTYLDELIGNVLEVLSATGLAETTRVIYVSDHGDNVGARGMWGKSNMYEESTGIPLIMAGAGVPAGKVSNTPVSLVDAHMTILDCFGLNQSAEEEASTKRSWFDVAESEDDPDRMIFSEYHAAHSPSAAFMIRRGRYKLIYYVDYPPELFDLVSDPEEEHDLAGDENYADILNEYQILLRTIIDPENIDRLAKNDQNALVEKFGGRDQALNTGTPGATPVPHDGGD